MDVDHTRLKCAKPRQAKGNWRLSRGEFSQLANQVWQAVRWPGKRRVDSDVRRRLEGGASLEAIAQFPLNLSCLLLHAVRWQ